MYIIFFFQRSHNFKNWQFKKKALRSHPPYLLLACKTFTNRTTIFIKPYTWYTVQEKKRTVPCKKHTVCIQARTRGGGHWGQIYIKRNVASKTKVTSSPNPQPPTFVTWLPTELFVG